MKISFYTYYITTHITFFFIIEWYVFFSVEFEENPEDTRGGCRVARSGENSLVMASRLLEIDPEELRQALVSRVMQSARGGFKGTVIM